MKTLTMKDFDVHHPLYENLSALGMPQTKTEQYRNFPISTILAKEYTFLHTRQTEYESGKKLVITNGVVIQTPPNVRVSYLNNFSVDPEHFDASYYISHMLSENVILLEVDEDVDLVLQHWFNHKETLLTYRVVVKVAEGIKINVYESFQTLASKESFLLYGTDVHLAKESYVTWIRNEKRLEDEASLVGSHRFICDEGANLELKTFDFGSVNALHLYKIDLQKDATIDASHLLLASEDARRGNVIYINHHGENAKSTQEARSILKDNALGIFDAKIKVGADAKYASAMQNSKAILLDQFAHMYAKPQLEIYTDELEASHGSTIGTIDEEALFYLTSRGIKREDAKRMLVLAFANTFIDKLQNEAFVKQLHEDFDHTI